MNTTTVFDLERVKRIAASYELEPSHNVGDDDWTYCEIAVPMPGGPAARADVSWDDDKKVWTVDPYFDGDESLATKDARTAAQVMLRAADLADDLNVPADVEPWDNIRRMTIDQFIDYAESIGADPNALARLTFPKN